VRNVYLIILLSRRGWSEAGIDIKAASPGRFRLFAQPVCVQSLNSSDKHAPKCKHVRRAKLRILNEIIEQLDVRRQIFAFHHSGRDCLLAEKSVVSGLNHDGLMRAR
jgi:hypothetical protein